VKVEETQQSLCESAIRNPIENPFQRQKHGCTDEQGSEHPCEGKFQGCHANSAVRAAIHCFDSVIT